MNTLSVIAQKFFACLVGFYPRSFRIQFGEEMQNVFACALNDAMHKGRMAVVKTFWHEMRDFPGALICTYWQAVLSVIHNPSTPQPGPTMRQVWKEYHGEIHMSQNIKTNHRQALFAALPPLLFGTAIALMWLVAGGRYYEIPQWRLFAGIAVGALPNLIIALVAIYALLKRLPQWSYAWVGSAMLDFILLLQVIGEEMTENGVFIPRVIETIGGIVILVMLAGLTLVTAWRGWRQAGQMCIGFATTLVLSICHLVAIPPFNHHAFAFIAAPLGLFMAFLLYLYVTKSDRVKIASLFTLEIVNIVVIMGANSLWNKPGMLLPLTMMITALLLAGPLAALIGSPLKKVVSH